MIFCTTWFLVFSAAMAGLYTVVRPWQIARLILLLTGSVYFYIHFAGITAFWVMLVLAVFTYLAGSGIEAYAEMTKSRPRLLLLFCISPAVLALLYFRYYEFLDESIRRVFAFYGFALSDRTQGVIKELAPIIHPLGISFFAFEFCHYLTDVFRGDKPLRNPLHFGIFALFYPRLASGPIVRFQQIAPQLANLPKVTFEDVQYGLLRISAGFAKKYLLADPAAQLVATSFQSGHIQTGTDLLWLSLLLYVRIYMDFSGYCDMAVGLARLWGIKLPENFNFPFLATSPSTFWRRWHISLSTWIRDYIYIPLGGARVAAWRKSFNLLFAMALCGLWHGSAWNFVAWGCLHGIALQVGHGLGTLCDFMSRKGPDNHVLRRTGYFVTKGLGWIFTQGFVSTTWVLFFFPLGDVGSIATRLLASKLGHWAHWI